MFKTLCVVVVVIAVSYSSIHEDIEHKPSCILKTQKFSRRLQQCPDYCGEISSRPLIVSCKRTYTHGCKCRKGYVKESIDSGFCIPKKECSLRKPCPRHQIYLKSGPNCFEYCGFNEYGAFEPKKECRIVREYPGCYCMKGYYLVNKTLNMCIPEISCVKRQALLQECRHAYPNFAEMPDKNCKCEVPANKTEL